MADALIELAERRTLSLLAVRFLDAALGTGRNLLFTGPLPGCLPLMAALVSQGENPGIFSAAVHGADAASSPPAPGAPGPEARPDRLAAWQQGPQGVAEALLQHVGVVGHLDAGRLDRCLMRLELALAKITATPTLGVLAALDLVVVVAPTSDGQSRVSEIYEIVLAEGGYRPAPLFVAQQTPAGEALVPQRAPSFLGALQAMGQGALAAELTAAEGAAPRPTIPQPAAAPVAPAAAPSPRGRGHGAKGERLTLGAPAPRPASAPGWELDQDVDLADVEPHQALVFADLLGDGAGASGPLPDETGEGDSEGVGLEPPPLPGAKQPA